MSYYLRQEIWRLTAGKVRRLVPIYGMLCALPMTFAHNRRWAVLLSAAMLAGISCRPERASVEELYTTRMLALGFLQRNQLAEAEAEFQKLIKLAPEDPFAYANLGLAYLQAGRYQEAEKQLDEAHELEPKNADVDLALARLYSLTKRESQARSTLERLRRESPGNARALYALAEMDARGSNPGNYEDRLRDVLNVAPANLAVRMDLINVLAKRGELDSAVRHLEEVRRIPPELPKEAGMYVDSAIQLLRARNVALSRTTLAQLRERIEVTAPYQASLAEVKWTEGPLVGRPILSFAPRGFVSRTGVREAAAIDVANFADATDDVGLGASNQSTAFAVGDIDGDGDDDLFLRGRAYRIQNGSIRDSTDRFVSAAASYATFSDYDNDGWLDLFAIGTDGRAQLYRNLGNGKFLDVSSKAAIGNLGRARKVVFADLDHDGDLDLLVVGPGPCKIFRNNLDGTFTESATGFGFGTIHDTRDADIGDFDDDGHIDVVLAGDNDVLMLNRGAQRFVASTSALSGGASNAIAAADYDNDGFLDVMAVGKGQTKLWHNRGSGTFTPDTRSTFRSADGSAAAFVDYDNDGWLDILVVGQSGLSLSRNDGAGKFLDRSAIIAANVRSARASQLTISDVDSDGDEDVWLVDNTGLKLLRNNGGNSNLAVNVELKALRTGSGKNNTLGIGSKLELRAGKIFQTRVATGRVTHFGLGPHLKADVLRIEWPNGVPQTVYVPGGDQDVVESETLKGSCALAYTWDGKQFRFATDAMWRSALGMPLGLMGGTSAFAPAGASQEYVRIDGNALKPRDGKYFLQLTEELWETAYADEVKLIAVDHPDSVDVFVDERFVPPGPVNLQLFQVPQGKLPLSAVDERGNDVLDQLREVDDIYVSNMIPTRYQGVVEPHDLIMDLGPDAGLRGTALFLRGWIYPTDASINVALSQQTSISIASPSLEVRDANGKWITVIQNIGFPSGKDKTVVIELSGKFPTPDHHVRIRTSMQIYWDKAFVAKTLSSNPVRITTLAPVSADLHYRGFSRMYRKGGRYGPYWFAYDDVAKTSPWRRIEGDFTRFGDVLSLLEKPDDRYVVMGPGDEATIQFDASSASSVPKGWKRDFLLYTDGWIKDSDLNTAFGTTVGPLPFHKLKSYPYGPNDKYPSAAALERYRREFNTRSVKFF
jgi:Flp pilus assembly protein TadD